MGFINGLMHIESAVLCWENKDTKMKNMPDMQWSSHIQYWLVYFVDTKHLLLMQVVTDIIPWSVLDWCAFDNRRRMDWTRRI